MLRKVGIIVSLLAISITGLANSTPKFTYCSQAANLRSNIESYQCGTKDLVLAARLKLSVYNGLDKAVCASYPDKDDQYNCLHSSLAYKNEARGLANLVLSADKSHTQCGMVTENKTQLMWNLQQYLSTNCQ